MTEQEKFMNAALKLARKAAAEGEVPVGCVVVRDGLIVGRGRNRRETKKDALGHAEIEAIHKACKKLGGWRLIDIRIGTSHSNPAPCAPAQSSTPALRPFTTVHLTSKPGRAARLSIYLTCPIIINPSWFPV